MARSEARISVTIWDDQRFVALSPGAQRLYLYLCSQRDLTYVGVIALRIRRWRRGSVKLAETDLRRDLAELERTGFAVVDHGTEELLIRGFIEDDRVYRQPNVLASAIDGLLAIASAVIRAELAAELRHVSTLDDLTSNGADVVARMLAIIGDPSPNPSRRGLGDGGSDPTVIPPGGITAVIEAVNAALVTPKPDTPGGLETCPDADSGTDTGKSGETAGHSHFEEGSPKGSGNPSAKGTAYQHVGNSYLNTEGVSPNPQVPKKTKTSENSDDTANRRDDVDRLCRHLADRIEGNGSKRPTVTKGWRTAARLLIDKDGRTEEQIRAAIDWCQDSEFWRSNIFSMPKLREKYDTLRLQAKRERVAAAPPPSNVRHIDRLTPEQRRARNPFANHTAPGATA